MIRAFCEAARAFGRDDYRDVAEQAGRSLLTRLVRDHRVYRSALGDRMSGPGMLEDFAAVGLALVDLYSLTFETSWLDASRQITSKAVELFRDAGTDTWYDTAIDHEPLLIRPREVTDNATPSGTSLVADLLLTWAELDDQADWRRLAERAVAGVGGAIAQYPQALGHMAGVADSIVSGGVQVAIADPGGGDGARTLVRRLGSSFMPGLVIAGGTSGGPGQPALMRERVPIGGSATAYVCRGFTCELPTTDPDVLERQVSHLIEDGRPGSPAVDASGSPAG
jgi:hypothetical protein